MILAKYQGEALTRFVETKLEGWLGLTLNRTKTRIMDLKETGASLDFLGYTFRYDRDLQGRNHRYLNLTPSKKAILKAKARIRELTGPAQCWKPPKALILEINRYLEGWAQYFRRGYPRSAFRTLNGYVCLRLSRHMHRRSQRPWRPPKDVTAYAQFHRLGLIYL